MPVQELVTQEMTLQAPGLRRLYADWRARRRSGGLPRRIDFDPENMKYILGSISLFEVCRDPLRFKCRVHGTELAIHLGMEITGRFFDELPHNPYFDIVTAHFYDVVTNARPSFGWLHNENRFPAVRENESLVLPLSRHGGDRVDFLLSAVIHHRPFSLITVQRPRFRLCPLPY